MTPQAFLHALGIKVGDPYDEEFVRERFKALWTLAACSRTSPSRSRTAPEGGKVLVIKVKERPVLTSVTYEDNRVATRTEIEDRLTRAGRSR